MNNKILICSLLLMASCTACNRTVRPSPQTTTSRLTVTLIGNTGAAPFGFGKGRVKFSPVPQSGNASCELVGTNPTTCTAIFGQGETVVLTAFPDASTLERIDGCTVTKCQGCSPGEATCQLTMNGDKSVTAVFVGLIP